MKSLPKFFALLALTGIVATSCQPEQTVNPKKDGQSQVGELGYEHELPSPQCSEIITFNLKDANGNTIGADYNTPYGTLKLTNDPTRIFGMIDCGWGYNMMNCDFSLLPVNTVTSQTNTTTPSALMYHYNLSPAPRGAYDFKEAVNASADKCLKVVFTAELGILDFNGDLSTSIRVWSEGEELNGGFAGDFCWVACGGVTIVPCTSGTVAGQFRTQTMGGWGSRANGNNPGTYRNANFSAAFPNGVEIGCAGGRKIKFTSSQAIENFLPNSGTAAVLPAGDLIINPTRNSLKNTLAGQVLALSLSVGFDTYDANFGASPSSLATLSVASGSAVNKSVAEALQIGNEVLGGCNANWTPSAINAVISKINENFVDGQMDGGFLNCPQ